MSKLLAFLCVLPLALSTIALAQDAPATDCDTYAASNLDPQRKTAGMPIDRINPALAVPACEAAVRQYPNSSRLAFELGRAFVKANNFAAAVAQYRRAADQGHAIAQNNLGAMYENGLGVAKDYAQAVAWYRKAAAQGYENAQATLRRLSAQDVAGSSASADQRNWFETYVVAHGGCGTNIGAYGDSMMLPQNHVNLGQVDVELFGKPVLKWSDDDIAAALSFFRACQARNHQERIDTCVRVSAPNRDCEHITPGNDAFFFDKFERNLRGIIMMARNLVAQRNAQQQATIELEKAQAENKRAQAEEEAQRKEQEREAAEEERKKAENQQAIAKAIEDRQAAEEKAAREKHEAELRNAERKREVESMPLTATDIQLAVDKVGKFVTDYSARKIDASNVEARLEEATRAADEAARLVQTVKDHMTQDDDPATLDLENKIVVLRPHLDELRAKIAGIPQEIAQEEAEKGKADQLAHEVAEEEADRQRDTKEVGERHLAVNIMFDNVLYVLNDGEVTVRLTDIQINGRRECTESATQNHAAWFNAANKLEDAERAHPVKLKVGESRRWLSPCRVIFSDITTYQGTRKYKSD